MMAIPQEIEKRSKATRKMLFTNEELGARYRYSCFVTNSELSATQVWMLYRQRADAENRIKELKYDFALDSSCPKKFWAPEAVFRSIIIAYNLMSLFRHTVLQTKSQGTYGWMVYSQSCPYCPELQGLEVSVLRASHIDSKQVVSRWPTVNHI